MLKDWFRPRDIRRSPSTLPSARPSDNSWALCWRLRLVCFIRNPNSCMQSGYPSLDRRGMVDTAPRAITEIIDTPVEFKDLPLFWSLDNAYWMDGVGNLVRDGRASTVPTHEAGKRCRLVSHQAKLPQKRDPSPLSRFRVALGQHFGLVNSSSGSSAKTCTPTRMHTVKWYSRGSAAI